MIKNIIFDIGNVLVHFRWRELMEELGFTNEQIESLYESMFLSSWWGEWDRGVIPEEEVMAGILKESKGLEEQVESFFKHKAKVIVQYPYAKEWILSLQKRGYKVYLLSNYPESLFESHLPEGLDFVPLVE